MMNNLTYSRVQRKSTRIPVCDYCSRDLSTEYILIDTHNDRIIQLFGYKKTPYSGKIIHLCEECFNKLHSMLEECESEGYEVLEEEN